MKKYNIPNLEGVCNVCGVNDDSPLKINGVIKEKGSFNENFHYHKKGHEYYILVRGEIIMGIKDESLRVKENEIVCIEPGEPHRVEQILRKAYYFVIKTNPDSEDKIILE